ncbi:Membrane protein involved in the export of O-antigen and teichoic acid [Salegentibacter agarivorans]|uniref:Membrane protein involved in the export of O-antigen and teichoic acid n=2 Tax=Salegentibacter TaxID=143222 RepID=A0A1I2K8N0_9FLAO|nr:MULTISPECIES: polysaccharide biosynthesis C-terminal domain-containing protein [Salegentibacter]APS39507.1 sugar isomerase [Salegentibacter sp. T436]SFF62678.1 Membrane protein involved in the export of O-antigen and teichoic acid [Salegentibacter agarivorans]
MGIIIKQSFKNLITTYFGFAIGAINTLFLFTYFLEPEYYGLVTFLLSAASLLWPFMGFGVHSTLIKFFTFYKTREEKDRLLNLVLFLPLIVSLLLGLIVASGYSFLINYFTQGNGLVRPYIWLIFLIGFATAYFEIFFAWSKLFYKSVFGNFMKEVFHRFCISLLLLGVYFNWITVHQFIYCIAGVFILRLIAMKIYAFSLYLPRLNFKFPKNLSPVLKYTSLILIAGSVATALLDLDKVMIEYFMPIENVAIYGIAIYIATVISVPQKAMHQITNPMTAEFLNTKNKKSLEELYKKSSLNLLIVSLLIFILIITNVKQLYELIPDEYELSILVVLLISLVKLYDNLLGNNNSILFNSDYYRIVLFIGVLLVFVAFVLNLIFIPSFGIEGAAIASFIAFFIYNSSKIWLVHKKFNFLPFTSKTWLVLFTGITLSIGFYFWDFGFHPILNIALKSILIGISYVGLAYFLNFSSEVNSIINKVLGIKIS